MQKEAAFPEHKRTQALRSSMKEAGTAGTSASISELYAVPFAKEIGTSPFYIGVLSALTGIAAPLAQLYGSALLHRASRKRIVLLFSLLQALLWLPLIALALALHRGMLLTAGPLLFILFYTLLIAIGNVSFPAWFSWLGDIVKEQERGRYFSKRNRIIGFAGLLIVLAGAFVIDLAKTRGMLLLGFASIFAIAFTLRLFSLTFIKRMRAPSFTLHSRDQFSLFNFLRRMDSVGKFALYLALLNAALMFASPFFAVYMLQELSFNYITLMAVMLSSTLFYLFFLPLAGRFSDRFGNIRLLHVANLFFILSPLCWILIQHPLLLIIVPQLVAGIANAALTIAATNFLYDAVSPKHRPLCVTYTNILAGIGTFFGSLLGGAVLSVFHPSTLSPFLFLFAMAALLRFLVGFIFLPHLKEARRVSPLPSFSLNLLHPFRSLNNDFTWVKRVLKEG